jgi:hypothetical protein
VTSVMIYQTFVNVDRELKIFSGGVDGWNSLRPLMGGKFDAM